MPLEKHTQAPKTYEEAEAYLLTLPRFSDVGSRAARFELDPIRAFCDAAGSPHKRINTVHVAGTNGKGSVCAMLASIYTKAGFRTGLYTSPHLKDVRERFRINGKMMEPSDLVAFFQEHYGYLQHHPLTFFELTTVIAFWYFAKEEVDIAIIETGLGGRLDATNIITPEVSVITSIGLDHTEQLGNTLQAIAFEKAGILKSQVPYVLGPIPPEVLQVITDHASTVGARQVSAIPLQPEVGEILSPVFKTQPFGLTNAQLCNSVIHALSSRYPVDNKAFTGGVHQFYHDRWLPGRFERMHPDLNIYFDGAHNAPALKSLVSSLSKLFDLKESICVVSLMSDKLNTEVATCFAPFGTVMYVSQNQPRAAGTDAFKTLFPAAVALNLSTETTSELIKTAKSKLVLFTGSFYFYSIVSEWMDSQLRIPSR